jgi:hypothetical protein
MSKKWNITILLLCIFSAMPYALENDLNSLFSDLLGRHEVSGKPTLAVIPFVTLAENVPAEAGRAISEYAVSFIAGQGKYRLVERSEFAKILDELELSNTGMIEEGQILSMGKMLSAEILVTGTIGDMLGKRMISAKIIKTTTGEILSASTITVGAGELEDFYKDALGERTQLSASLFRSLLAPGWGQFYTGHPGQGALFSFAALAGVGTVIWSAIDWSAKSATVETFNEYRNIRPGESLADYKIRRDEAMDEEGTALNRTAVIGGITGAIWVVNLIDAAILGSKDKRRIKNLYFSSVPGRPGLQVSLEL